MSKVLRAFVEKKDGFDIASKQMLNDLRENLGIKTVEELRLFNRYDVEGLSVEEFEKALWYVFAEPNADNVQRETLSLDGDYKILCIEYLPGQYDVRADSAAQCVQLLTQKERPQIRTARVIALAGEISENEFEKIKNYLINPVESRVASNEKPQTLEQNYEIPVSVETVEGFIYYDELKLAEYHKSLGLAMTVSDLVFCRDYFKNTEKRDPTITELRVIDTYWSDHCRHTTFLTRLDTIKVEDGDFSEALQTALDDYFSAREEIYSGKQKKDISLMDMALAGMKLLKKQGKIPDLDESEEINACSIEATVTIDGKPEQWLVQFKNETHNHPTEIEPFGGAATCLGGAIRDPLSGRSYVYQAMRVTGSGDPTLPFEKTLPGKLPTRKITTGAAQGYSSYGNQIGLATGQVVELYDPGYVAKRMEIGAVIAAGPKSNVVREIPASDDVIVLLGGKTGRDGCGGATGSSKAHSESSIETCGAEVQKGNPVEERKIQRLFRNPKVSTLIKRCNDFGAGGVCVAIGELADGLTIDLNKVPKKYNGLDGTELAISESQERMAVVLDKKDVADFIAAADNENLEATPVAIVTAEPRLKMQWEGKFIVDISREFLNTNGVTQTSDAVITSPKSNENYRKLLPEELKNLSGKDAFLKNLKRLNVCSQIGLSGRFDSSIGAASVLMPFGGKNQLTPQEAMVSKLPLIDGETDDSTAMSYGFIPAASKWSPFHGSAFAVVESLSRLLAVGANPLMARLTFQEYFERLKSDPKRWGKPAAALLGAMQAQLQLGVPSIGGKDSMSGSFEDIDVPPTLCSFAVAMTKASKTISSEFKNGNSQVIFVPVPVDEKSQMPVWSVLKNVYTKLYKYISGGSVLSASVVKEGGIAACVAKACFGNNIGFEFSDKFSENIYYPLSGSLVLEIMENAALPDVAYELLGRTISGEKIIIGGEKIDLNSCLDAWKSTLESVFPTKADCPRVSDIAKSARQAVVSSPKIKIAKPKVFIPAFPGTNCEIDTYRAFKNAGAEVDILVVKNLNVRHIEETIAEMEKRIRSSQIVMIPGGFSGGDEPDGSGKFVATTFRNPRISEAISDLLNSRDGLMLGICNGFQALIKLGLLPYGKICDISESDPTLTFNTIGRHISTMAYTKVVSNSSPWLRLASTEEIYAIPVSHGEGRFVADDETLIQLIENGQIATQYVDPLGQPGSDTNYNVNGSVYAVEGITSPDGRILGKMGHSERKGKNVCKNVPFEKDQKIFESGVQYFK